MSEENKEIARRFYAEISKGNLDVIDQLVADNFVEHEEMPGVSPDREGVRQWLSLVRAAFPDFQMMHEDMVAEGDKVFIRARMTGTHRGDFMGIPATGQQIDVPFADVIRIENGKAVEHWGISDTGVMLQQLGVIDAPGGEGESPGIEVQE